jgi:hypothetical protein
MNSLNKQATSSWVSMYGTVNKKVNKNLTTDNISVEKYSIKTGQR